MLTKGTDLAVQLEDRPGTLAKVTAAIAASGANIDGFSGAMDSSSTVHFVFTADAAKAKAALESAGFKVARERDVVLVDVEDKPGVAARELGKVARRGINIDLGYVATNDRLVLGSGDFQALWEALGESGSTSTRG